jgi:hypothetical protein
MDGSGAERASESTRSRLTPVQPIQRIGRPAIAPLCRHVVELSNCVKNISSDVRRMITAAQLRAARALAGMDQRALAKASALSLPTIQRMEASEGVIRGNVDSLMKLIAALDAAGIELIGDGAVSARGGRGVRLKVR